MSAEAVPNGQHLALSGTQSLPKKNNAEKAWIVQKFGGTSVGKFAVNIAEEIVRYGVYGACRYPSLISCVQCQPRVQSHRRGMFGTQHREEGGGYYESVRGIPPPITAIQSNTCGLAGC